MYNDNTLEKGRLRERFKDLSILALATVITAVISIVVMNIIITPLVHLAVKNTILFTAIFKTIIKILVIAVPVFLIVKSYRTLLKNGISHKDTALYLLKKPARFAAVFLFLLVCSIAVITILYLLLNYNNYFIYKITN